MRGEIVYVHWNRLNQIKEIYLSLYDSTLIWPNVKGTKSESKRRGRKLFKRGEISRKVCGQIFLGLSGKRFRIL